jgi:hypothetical protein
MTNISSVARERIEAQGFCGFDDGLLSKINYPLRLAPAICMVWTLVGIVLGSPIVIGALVPFAILGAVLPGHPFDVIFNFGLRHIFKLPALPRYGKRRRLACVAASTALTVSALSFQFGISPLGYLLAGMVVAGTLLNVSTGICPPAAIAAVILGRVDCKQGLR